MDAFGNERIAWAHEEKNVDSSEAPYQATVYGFSNVNGRGAYKVTMKVDWKGIHYSEETVNQLSGGLYGRDGPTALGKRSLQLPEPDWPERKEVKLAASSGCLT